jgi:NAD-dependent deacetylase
VKAAWADIERIVVLTGAGVSAESGLATFRGAGGLWEGHRIEEVATPEAFARDPATVLRFYDERRRQLRTATIVPNPAHLALARLEREHPGEVLLITQNVDDLHRCAGSRRLVHMHGELMKARCTACGSVHPWQDDLIDGPPCPRCGRRGKLRPNVIWFGEMPLELDRIYDALAAADLFVAIGTSGNVYPAAGFVEAVRSHGRARCLELNLEPGQQNRLFDEHRAGPAGVTVPALVDELLSDGG